MLETTPISISTTVCIAKIDTVFDIEMIYENINIDDTILGIKYINNTKGSISNKSSFYNQSTVILYLKKYDKNVNLKIFSNGKFQITGIKNEEQASYAIMIFLKRIGQIKANFFKNIEVIKEDNLLYNRENYDIFHENIKNNEKYTSSIKIYGYVDNSYKLIGERKKTGIFFSKIQVENLYDYIKSKTKEEEYHTIPQILEKLYVSKKHINNVKTVYSNDGVLIGDLKINFSIERKHLTLVKCYITIIPIENNKISFNIYNKNNFIIGNINITFLKNVEKLQERNEDYNPETNTIKFFKKCISNDIIRTQIQDDTLFNDFETFQSFINIETTNINCMFSINLNDDKFDRCVLNDILSNKYKLNSYYNKDFKYNAINLKVYINDINKVISTEEENSKKITFLMFHNGKILLCGCVNKKQILSAKNFIVNIILKEYDNIIVKNKNDTTIIKNKDITIWDLIS